MELSYSTAGLLFPAISLLMLAYTNRFLGLASLVRHLATEYRHHADHRLMPQIESLKGRILLLRHAQGTGVSSLLLCTLSICLLFLHQPGSAQLCFAAALLAMVVSLVFSLREIYLSVRALHLELDSLTAPPAASPPAGGCAPPRSAA